jgi:glutamate synthase (NADPH/NADH) small chain
VDRAEWRDAIDRLHATNNFPEFTGRLCPAPCETACVLGINQPAVTIKQVEVRSSTAPSGGWVTPQRPSGSPARPSPSSAPARPGWPPPSS